LRNLIFILSFLALWANTAFAQGLVLNTALRFQIATPGSTGTTPNFTVSGYVGDDLMLFDANSVSVGDSLYVLEGSELHVFVVSDINSAGGYMLNMDVTGINTNLTQIPPGQAAIIKPTTNNKYPTYIASLRDDLRSAIMNRLSQLVDAAAVGAADGTVTSAAYDGSTLTITKSIGGNVTTSIQEVVNTTANPSGAPGTGQKIWINRSTGNMWYASASVWVPIPGATWSEEVFNNVTGSTIAATGPLPSLNTDEDIVVYRSGVKLTQDIDYTVSGNNINLVVPGQGELFSLRYKKFF
jgi:hypothetical protein